jgi:manganese transport protein
MANLMAILIQYLTSKAGLATGQSLPELCRQRYGRRVNTVLWLQAEVVAMATDLAEFVGAALGLNLVFGTPLLPAGLITAVVAFVILALERRGHRRFELAVIALLALVGAGFIYLFFTTGGQDSTQLGAVLIPRVGGGDSLSLTVAIIGATVIPHVVYLHSALPKNRISAATSANAAPCSPSTSGTASSPWPRRAGQPRHGLHRRSPVPQTGTDRHQ